MGYSPSGLGRRTAAEKFGNVNDYLNQHVFPIKDELIIFRKDEAQTLKKWKAAQAKRRLQEQKLEWAYNGLEKFRTDGKLRKQNDL